MKNIRDKSHSVIQTVQHSMATKELDMHCITERIAAMSYPADGIESAFKNHIDDISATIESKHSNKVYLPTQNIMDPNNNLPQVSVVNDLIIVTEEDRLSSTESLVSTESQLTNDSCSSTSENCCHMEFGENHNRLRVNHSYQNVL